MADVTVSSVVNLRVTDAEWKLIMRALAYAAGISKITFKPEAQVLAEALNKQLLKQRVDVLKEQLMIAEGALKIAEDEATTGH